jgi:AcrR family transcriptional regulator
MQSVAEKWTPERRRQLTRDALVDAAAEVFARRGFEGATLEEIAETAGYTRGAIYKHFDGKEELFFAVLDKRIEAQFKPFSDVLERGREAAADPAQLSEAWHQVLSRESQWVVLDLEFRLYALRNPEVRERWVAHEQELRRVIVKFMEDHLEAAGLRLRIPAETLAAIVVPTSQGLVEWSQLDPDSGDMFAAFLDLIMTAVIEQPKAPAKRARR